MRNKKDRWKLFLLMGMMTAAAIVSTAADSIRARAYQYADVELYEAADGKRYLFLPAWADRRAEEERYGTEENLTVMQSQGLPAVSIRTQGGSLQMINENKGEVTKARITITLADGTKHYEGVIGEMKGRGNSTWGLDKKPYQLKLEREADLFGMGEAKTWILLANGFDETGIRNTIALNLARDAGLSYTPQSVAVDLYCDSQYMGNYLLCEKVEAGHERVDIGNGFLIERELKERYEIAVYIEGKKGFQTDRGEYFLIESPKQPTQEEISEIRAIVQAAEDAVFSADGINPDTGLSYTELLDMGSFVRKYLLEEITKNYDGGVTSAYYYVPEGEKALYAGPAWDYDVVFGNSTLDELNSDPQGITELSDHLYGPDFYSALMEREEFRREVFSCFKEVYLPLLEKLLEEDIDVLSAETAASMRMNHLRWEGMENRHQYYDSYEDNLRYLKFYVDKRLEYLKEVWLDGVVYHTVELSVEGAPWRKFYVKDGGLLGDLPAPFLNDHLFIGWYREDGVKYDPYRPVYQNMVFEASWQRVNPQNLSTEES